MNKVGRKRLREYFLPPKIEPPITLDHAKSIAAGAISVVTVFAAVAYAAGIFAVHAWLTVYHLQTESFARTGYLLSGVWVLYPAAIVVFGISMVSRLWPLAISATIVSASSLLFWILAAELDPLVPSFLLFTLLLFVSGWLTGGSFGFSRDTGALGVVVVSATIILFLFALAFWILFLERVPSSIGGKVPRQIRLSVSHDRVFDGDTIAQQRFYPLALEDDDFFYISKGSDTSIAVRKDAVQVAEFVISNPNPRPEHDLPARVDSKQAPLLEWLDIAGKFSLILGALAACSTALIAWIQLMKGRAELRRSMYPICVAEFVASGAKNPVSLGNGPSGFFVRDVHFLIRNDGNGPALNMEIKVEQGGAELDRRPHQDWQTRGIPLQEAHRVSLAKRQQLECFFVMPAGASVTRPESPLKITIDTDTVHQNRIRFTYEAPMTTLAAVGEENRKLKFCGIEELRHSVSQEAG